MTRLHFIGVGGSGMSAVAHLWSAHGATVTGTDRKRSAYFSALEAAGMDVRIGEDPSLVDHVDAVVVSSAVREDNAELARARERGVAVWHRSEALVTVLEGRRLAAVAGSHGKTTTSAMLATALHGAGIDAGFAVGARVFGVDGAVAGGYAGTANVAVVEADESDGSFLRYRPAVGIVTNIEVDHLDHYGTVERLNAAFAAFAAQCETLVVCADDAGAARLIPEAERAGVKVISYGATSRKETATSDESRAPNAVPLPNAVPVPNATPAADDASGTTARAAAEHVLVSPEVISRAGEEWPLVLPVPGAHNRLNATAAWIAAVELGAEPKAALKALEAFAGTGRRFQRRGEIGGVRVIDDYAHHPTEVAALVRAARDDGAGHLVIVFQPALFSRTQALAAEFGAALSIPDSEVIVAPVHGDREEPIPGVSSESITRAVSLQEGQSVELAESLESAARIAARRARKGDVVLTVGSGTVTDAAQWILDALESDGVGAGPRLEASGD